MDEFQNLYLIFDKTAFIQTKIVKNVAIVEKECFKT